jgi:hypothetical protein
VRQFTDEHAKLYKSAHKNDLFLVETTYLTAHWAASDSLTHVSVQEDIGSTPKASCTWREDVWGYVRLSNILPNGVMLDFDFAGDAGQKTYPLHLQELHLDGKHHNDVEACIKQNMSLDLATEKKHHQFSIAFKMLLPL